MRRVNTASLPYRAAIDAAIDAAVDVAQKIREGLAPPTETAYSEMHRRLVEFSVH